MRKYILSLIFVCSFCISNYSQDATVISENANLRGTPTTKGKVVDVLPNDTLVEVIKQKGVWFLVQATDYVGWIHGNTIKLTDSSSLKSRSVISQPAQTRSKTRRTKPRRTKTYRTYIRGPRGGCYYINSNGNKTYVARSLCN